MPEPRNLRISRELFLGALGSHLGRDEAWVTDRLASLLEEDTARAGDILFRIGDEPDHYYFMREGRVELLREGYAPMTLEGRSVFGMADALLERPRNRTARAITDLELMRVQTAGWMELLEDSFELARLAVVATARNVAGLEEAAWRAAESASPVAAASQAQPIRRRPLDVIERLAALMDVPLLRGAGVQPLSDLAESSEEIVLEKGEKLFARGGPSERFFVVVEGRVEALRENPSAKWTGGAGEIVCGAAALTGLPMAWEARASAPTRALAFRLEDWFDLLEEHFDVVRSTLAAFTLQRERLIERRD